MRSSIRPLLACLILCLLVFVIKTPWRTYFGQPFQNIPSAYIYTLPQGVDSEEVQVESVSDGDTVTVGGGQRVRFLDIDTPELAHPDQHIREECYGKDATLRLTQLIDGKKVVLVRDKRDTDKYQRLLRYVFLPLEATPGAYLNVNAYMVGEGYARVFVLEGETRYKDDLFELQTQAKDEKKGLWGSCDRDNFRW